MPRSGNRPPHIVLIVLDTHRLDRLGCYGWGRGTSPNIDAFAAHAALYETAITPGQWTIPAHASLFTGEPSSVHMTTQGGDVLPSCFPVLAEVLAQGGYRTAAFCNNPLVGVINNGLRRGFDTFYNYGGAAPSGPSQPSSPGLAPFRWVLEQYTQALRRVAYPIQNLFATSGGHFRAALSPFWVPIWTRIAHFKGNTANSIRDTAHFVRERMNGSAAEPQFVFLNLMETHFPFLAPKRFVRQFAPAFLDDPQVAEFMKCLNRQGARWLTPLSEPLAADGSGGLSDMYDAEVAYQDHLLGELLSVLGEPEHLDNTLTVIVSDHGEMLGEHRLMGHAFGVFNDLIRVPLVVRFPGQLSGKRITQPVSTARLFHTALDLAGIESYRTHYSPAVDVRSKSLRSAAGEPSRSDSAVVCEAVPPGYAVSVAEGHGPGPVEDLHCRLDHYALFENEYKLSRVEGVGDQLLSLDDGQLEENQSGSASQSEVSARLSEKLSAYFAQSLQRRPQEWASADAAMESDQVRQRLRDLGYIE